MKKTLPAALAFALLTLQACDTTTTTDTSTTTTQTATTDTMAAPPVAGNMDHDTAMHMTPDDPAAMSGTDMNAFMMKAADNGMAEVAHGQLVADKGSNAEVKKFAQQMVTDHTKANNELKTLAGRKNVTLPATMSQKHQHMQEQLSRLSGAELDRMYMSHMVTAHDMDVSMFRNASQSMPDADTKAFAAKQLPVLESHLEMARRINGQVGAAAAAGR